MTATGSLRTWPGRRGPDLTRALGGTASRPRPRRATHPAPARPAGSPAFPYSRAKATNVTIDNESKGDRREA